MNPSHVEDNTAQRADKARWPFPETDMTSEFVTEAMKLFEASKDKVNTNLNKEVDKLKVGQKRARDLNKLLRLINQATDPATGTLHVEPGSELALMLQAASEAQPSSTLPPLSENDPDQPLDRIEIDPAKVDYSKDEVDRLLDNIRLSADDLTVYNDMLLQNVNRLVTQQQELYQIIKSFLKPLHDTKIAMARSLAGR